MEPRKRRLSPFILVLALLVACASWSCSDGPSTGASPAPHAAELSGTWLGTLELSGLALRIVINLEQSAEGPLRGTTDSPDQGVLGIPVSGIEVADHSVTISVASIGAVFVGQLSADAQALSGTITQAGEVTALTLLKQPGPLDYRRPQDPRPPLPYNSKDITFPSEQAGVTLAGTLTWPEGAGPFTTVVLISGSGAQNRDEELFNHRPFLVLADALSRRNIAVLRYDDRGFGESSGDFALATTPDFAADARGALRFLLSQNEFSVGPIGLVGHSEGGAVAPLAADGNADVAFLVLLAGPGVDGKTTLISQGHAIREADGVDAAELERSDAQLKELYSCFEAEEQELDELDGCLRTLLTPSGLGCSELSSTLAQLEAPWMRYFVTYDPAPVLRRTTVPVLALNGTLDLQVLADLNVPAIEDALRAAGNAQFSVQKLSGLNHLFQHARSGLPEEYGTIAETMAPEVLTLIPDWIESVVSAAP